MAIDAVDLEVMKASLSGIVQEMQNSLFRTGFSTIVRESQDASCALMNAKGEVVAQHVVLPLHIGAFPACTAAIIDAFRGDIAEGDGFIINHPYHGGSPHAPDIAVITPVFVEGELFGFCGSIAHKSDIGGPGARKLLRPGARDFQRRPAPPCRALPPRLPGERRHRAADRRQHAYAGTRARAISADNSAPTGWAKSGWPSSSDKFGKQKILACFDRLFELSENALQSGRRRLAGRPFRGGAVRRR